MNQIQLKPLQGDDLFRRAEMLVSISDIEHASGIGGENVYTVEKTGNTR